MENNQTNTYMEETNLELVHTYNRFPVVLDHGEGVYLYDTEGKKYLDFAAGIAVCGLGYSNEEYKTALKNQIDLLTHTSNLYYNTTCGKAAKALLKACEMDKVFFTNSGTEAIEGALKAARKICLQKVPDVMSSLLWKILSMEEVWEHCLLPEQSITERHLSH